MAPPPPPPFRVRSSRRTYRSILHSGQRLQNFQHVDDLGKTLHGRPGAAMPEVAWRAAGVLVGTGASTPGKGSPKVGVLRKTGGSVHQLLKLHRPSSQGD